MRLKCPVLVLVFLVLACVGPSWGGQVLVFPGEFSHWLNMRSLILELQRRNHSVSVMVSSASPSVRYTDPELQKNFNFIVLEVPHTKSEVKYYLRNSVDFMVNQIHRSSWWATLQGLWAMGKHSMAFSKRHCEAIVKNASVLEKIRALEPDLILYDPLVPGGDLVASLLGVPLVVSLRQTPGGAMERMCGHALFPPSFVPWLAYDDHMTFRQRIANFLLHVLSSVFILMPWRLSLDQIYSEALGYPTSVCETLGRADLWLIRAFWDIETSRPLPPHFRYVGGFHCKMANPLPEDLEEWMRSADDGVVVVSFGSIVTHLTMERAEVIATALAQIPQKVIWRYSGPPPHSLGPNTKLLDWIPQNDVLGHPQTRAMVTHGGMNGLYEAVYHGVPLVGTPLFGDQENNLDRMSRLGCAIILNFSTMTSLELYSAISEIINNPRYRQSMLRLTAVHRDRPIPPLQETVFWLEYVMRQGGAPHLRLASHDFNWIQYYSLDVLAFLLLAVGVTIAAVTLALRLTLKLGLRLIHPRGPRPHQD